MGERRRFQKSNKDMSLKNTEQVIPTRFIPKPDPVVVTPQKRIGMLVSRLPQSVEIAYAGEALKVAPRGRTAKDIDYDKLGTLPKGMTFVG